MGEASEAFFSRVYDELQRLAAKYQTEGIAERTSLVHEAFLKMEGDPAHRDTQHFYAIAATAMRQVLVDRARAKQAAKRGGGMQRVSLTGLGEGEEESNIIRGKVDAEIIEDYAKAITETGDLFNFLRQLEMYEKSLTGQTRLILTTDSELFQLLKESGKPASLPAAAPSGAAAGAAESPRS